MTILSTAAADAVDVDGSGWDVSLALEIGPHPMRMIVVLVFCGIISLVQSVAGAAWPEVWLAADPASFQFSDTCAPDGILLDSPPRRGLHGPMRRLHGLEQGR